jgi:hypothetical protein
MRIDPCSGFNIKNNTQFFISAVLDGLYMDRCNDSLRARRSGDRIPAGGGGGDRITPPGQTNPGAQPAPCTMGTGFVSGE